MKPRTNQPSNPTPRGRPTRGNTLVLVIVVLVLLALLGTTYIQVARMQRAVAAEPPDNIDLVLESVVKEVKRQLKGDVFNDPTSNELFGANVEAYDYPWTNESKKWRGTATWPNQTSGPDTGPGSAKDPIDGNTTREAVGNDTDDIWLGSTTPEYRDDGGPGDNPDVDAGNWPHISRLTPRFFVVGGPGSNPGDMTTGGLTAKWFKGNSNEDENVDPDNLVDADGDGIGDSQWERAPIGLMDGVKYFMAVRIVDLSSLDNVNAATVNTASGKADKAPGQVTGYWPSGLDLGRLAYKKDNASWDTRLTKLFDNLRGSRAAAPSFPTPFTIDNLKTYDPSTSGTGYGPGQVEAWLDGGREYGKEYVGTAQPMFELQWRGGLDDPSRTTAYEDDDGMGTLLDDPYDPTAKPDQPVTGGANADRDHFVGTDPNDVKETTFPTIRPMLTTYSGKGLYSTNHAVNGTNFKLREDLVYQETGLNGKPADAEARVKRLRDRLKDILQGYSPPGSRTSDEVAREYALAIKEYSDADGVPQSPNTNFKVNGKQAYGLEALPFLREVYMQVAYEDPNGDPTITPKKPWTPINNSNGVIIEMANPFDRPIEMGDSDDDQPHVRVVILNPNTDTVIDNGGKLKYAIPDGKKIEAMNNRTSPSTDHVLAITSQGSNPTNESDDGDGKDLKADVMAPNTPTKNASPLNANDALSNIPIDKDLAVGLQVEVDDGSGGKKWVTYDRLNSRGVSGSLSFPDEVDFADPGANPPTSKTKAYIQKTLQRDGQGIRYISNKNKTLNARAPDPDQPDKNNWPENPGGFKQGLDKIGKNNKGFDGETDLDNLQIPMANRPIFSKAELGWIFMFGFTDDKEGDFPQRLSGEDGTGGIKSTERFLQFPDDNSTPATAKPVQGDSNNPSYAQAILDGFTTLSPRHDGVDNDDDQTTDEDDEQFVFGTMNINTAPLHLATLAASYPQSADKTQKLMKQLVDKRQSNNGLRSDGRLVSLIAKLVEAGKISNPPTNAGSAWDLYPMYETKNLPTTKGGQEAKAYKISGDAEQKMKIAQFLLQNYSTRSDVYIAHILVKGYRDADGDGNIGGSGDELVESGRLMVIFNRGKMTTVDDDVAELGRYRY